jgi:hypothetical protein
MICKDNYKQVLGMYLEGDVFSYFQILSHFSPAKTKECHEMPHSEAYKTISLLDKTLCRNPDRMSVMAWAILAELVRGLLQFLGIIAWTIIFT